MKKHIKSILTKFFPHAFPKYINPFSFLKKYSVTSIVDVGANVGQFAKEINYRTAS